MSNLSLIHHETKRSQKNLIFDGKSGLKLEMISYSDNDYDVTNFFVVLKSSWPVLYSDYQVSLLSDPKWQSLTGGFLGPPSIIWVSPDPIQNRVKKILEHSIPM